ncbi:hypothetical protein GCM10010844_36680 [Deinococcus radiotolerans]|uniref:Uncharacterized protein n=1 Tax=Deinococcus radiotolerans TaxID=1309407 RepID=A0ABQ2FPM8_9DEIO|nr:hypothetical protein GCM10010844_36680 [Deinococcus radiotolerans]
MALQVAWTPDAARRCRPLDQEAALVLVWRVHMSGLRGAGALRPVDWVFVCGARVPRAPWRRGVRHTPGGLAWVRWFRPVWLRPPTTPLKAHCASGEAGPLPGSVEPGCGVPRPVGAGV